MVVLVKTVQSFPCSLLVLNAKVVYSFYESVKPIFN